MQIKSQAEFTPDSLTLESTLLETTLTSSIFMNIGIFYDKLLSIVVDDKTVWFVEAYLYKWHTYILLTNMCILCMH